MAVEKGQESAPTTHPEARSKESSVFTAEMGLWAVLALVALTLRLLHLDAAPLDAREARQAVLAWHAATGQGLPTAGYYSPLPFAANALLFFLCGESDFLARLWPALVGSALALTPLFLRRSLGRVGALAAGLYLSLSPVAIAASRRLDGAVFVALGGMAFLGGLMGFLGGCDRRWLVLSAAGLAFAVASGELAYGLAWALGAAGLLVSWGWPSEKTQQAWSALRVHLGFAVGLFMLFVLAFATALGWNPLGLGAIGGLAVNWISRFVPSAVRIASPVTLLALYEPLSLIAGVGGLIESLRRRHRVGLFLGIWACLSGLLLMLTPGREPLDVLGVVVPLALLAGLGTEALLRRMRSWGWGGSVVLYMAVALVLSAYIYLRLAGYSTRGDKTELVLMLLALILPLMLIGLIFLLSILLRMIEAKDDNIGPEDVEGEIKAEAHQAGLASVVVVTMILLAITVSAGWRATQVYPADPRGLLVSAPTGVEVRDLVRTLSAISWRKTGTPTELPFVLEAPPDSVLAWYLRDFAAWRVDNLAELEESAAGPVIVTMMRRDLPFSGSSQYAGQDFALQKRWDPSVLTCAWDAQGKQFSSECKVVVGWLLFRVTPFVPQPIVEQYATLWVQRDWVQDSSYSH